MYLNFHVSLNICCLFWIQSRLWALTQNQLTRYQRTRIGSFEIWNNSCISMNLAYLRETWPLLVLSNWYLGSNFFGKGSDTSFTFLRCPRLLLCSLSAGLESRLKPPSGSNSFLILQNKTVSFKFLYSCFDRPSIYSKDTILKRAWQNIRLLSHLNEYYFLPDVFSLLFLTTDLASKDWREGNQSV